MINYQVVYCSYVSLMGALDQLNYTIQQENRKKQVLLRH